ncbi:hypothetical protein VTL71DRAFT_15694 [Oculimacula yallundae]|uniref:mannan endo-1,4-beta-mannosidase n=1 Tax=Oculimacula yallundae TaxID=86028 RepID=A0ABR4CHA6_9HELO
MRFIPFLSACLCIAFAQSQTTLSTSVISAPASTPTSALTTFAKTSGRLFTINGKTQYFSGTNSYWIGFLTNDSDVDLVMSHIASTGLKVLRVWGFNDVTSQPSPGTVWFQSFIKGSEPVINTGSDGLQRLDSVVRSAEAHGVSLIINFVNNWDDYGGMSAYNKYYGVSNWYKSSAAQAQYQKYIAAVVTRYRNSTAIFAWELANEPRCTLCFTSDITNWVRTSSAYIKSLDPNHMVAIGDEGFGLNGGSIFSWPFLYVSGLNFKENLAIPTIDFGTYHLYPSAWWQSDSWGPDWIKAHATVAAEVGKPVILEEYGSKTHGNAAAWQSTVLSTVTAGDLYWQFGDRLSGGLTHDDGFTLYYGSDEYISLVSQHAAAMAAKAV